MYENVDLTLPQRLVLRHVRNVSAFLISRIPCIYVAIVLTSLFGSPVSADHFRVFLLGGQSNMGGVAPVEDLEPPFDQPNEDVWIWQDDEVANVGWTALRGGFSGSGSTGNDDTFGPEVSLGDTLAGSFGTDRVAFVKHGEAGVGATMQLGWNPDLGGGQGPGQIYSDFLDKTNKALSFLANDGHSFEVSGVFFAQGNRDTSPNEDGGNAAVEYEANFSNFTNALRNEFETPNLPIVFGQLGDFAINHENPIRRRNVRLVRDAQASVAANDPWASMVVTDDISKLDHAHFDAAGQIDFGQRLGNAYLELVAVPEPSSGALAGFAVVCWFFYRKRRRN